MKKVDSLIKHPEFGEVRTVSIKGEPWFVAMDVCAALGIQNSRDAVLKGLDDDEAGVGSIYISSENGVNQRREVVIVNESGLYSLIFQSRKPSARAFRKWVTSEVLPSIRKFGYYVHPAYMDAKRLKRMQSDMNVAMSKYVYDEDVQKTAKKFGMRKLEVQLIMIGRRSDNAVMQELQRRAEFNKASEIDAYAPERMRQMIELLKS
jgi:prophage antirepressor-like protein